MTPSLDAGKTVGLQQSLPLIVSRTFHARRETVFEAWSTADHVKELVQPADLQRP